MSPTRFTRETIIFQTRIDIVYCSQEVKVEVLKSTITNHYTVQTKLDEETKKAGLKMQQYYRHWAILEHNSVSEKLVFKLKHKLQGFQIIIFSCVAIHHLKIFDELLLMKKKTLCAREEIKVSQTYVID